MEIYVNARFLTQNMTGVQRYAIELSKQLKRLYDDKIKFVCPKNVVNKEMYDELDAIVIGRHTGHLWEQWDLPRYLKKQGKPLLLNLSNSAPIVYKNKVTTLHDITFVRHPGTFSKAFVALYRLMIPQVIRTSRHLFTVSEFSKKEICSFYHVDPSKISVIYNAVSGNFTHIEDKELLRNKYFMAVSSVKGNKNFIYILEAFSKFSEKSSDICLYVVGDLQSNSFKTIDISKYLSNPRIKVIGRVSDEELVRYYSNAYAFLFPSLYEGFGIPPLEAQACGCPVICADASCLPEVFGDSVLYCDPYNPDSLITQMNKLTNNVKLREHLINLGETNVNRYSWKASAIHMTEILVKYLELCI